MEIALRIGYGQKNASYHLGKLRNRGMAHYNPETLLWEVDPDSARASAARQLADMRDDFAPILLTPMQN